jgi:hypothetical protein
MSAALGYIVAQHKQIKRATAPQVGYSTRQLQNWVGAVNYWNLRANF